MELRAERVRVCAGPQTILHATSVQFTTGQVVGLIGPNGAGKSTLLRTLCQLQNIESGRVLLDGQDMAHLPSEQRARSLAYLPQLTECHWPLKTEHVVALGREPYHHSHKLQPSDLEAISMAMQQADVQHLMGRTVNHLSGGELARVMLARALATQAPLLLADEPTAGLDVQHQLKLMELFRQLADQGHGVIVVLHELHLAMRFCDRLVLLHEGHCVADGQAAEVLTTEHLQNVYGIQAQSGVINNEPWLLPWSVVS